VRRRIVGGGIMIHPACRAISSHLAFLPSPDVHSLVRDPTSRTDAEWMIESSFHMKEIMARDLGETVVSRRRDGWPWRVTLQRDCNAEKVLSQAGA